MRPDGLGRWPAGYGNRYDMKNNINHYETGFGHGLMFAIGLLTGLVVSIIIPIELIETVFEWLGLSETVKRLALSETVKSFLKDEKFLFPFFSTLGATITVLLFQFIQRVVSEKKKKIFAISYIYDVCFRIFEVNMILKKHTILPHIEAIERVFNGEVKLLKEMFESGDFKILPDKSLYFSLLPEEYRVLLGCDNIRLIQAFEAMVYLYSQSSNSEALNNHVNDYLASETHFLSLSGPEQTEILESYLGNLNSVKHENDRAIWFVFFVMLPALNKYSKSMQFLGFNLKSIKSSQKQIALKIQEYNDLLPDQDLMNKKKESGIQSKL